MLFYYGVDLVDVVNLNGPPPSFVLELIRGLPDDSMTVALRRGGMEFFGWGTDRYIAADTFDALRVNTYATGNWAKTPEKPTPYPRPVVKSKVKKKASVADLFGRLRGKLGG